MVTVGEQVYSVLFMWLVHRNWDLEFLLNSEDKEANQSFS
jgi:hypothetical protein